MYIYFFSMEKLWWQNIRTHRLSAGLQQRSNQPVSTQLTSYTTFWVMCQISSQPDFNRGNKVHTYDRVSVIYYHDGGN